MDITDFGTGMTFQLDEIKSSDYGEASNLSCQLEYVLPPGAYQINPILKDSIRFKKLLNEMVSLCRDLWPNLLDEEIAAKVTDFMYLTALTSPSDKIQMEHPIMRKTIMHFCFYYEVDDAVDKLLATNDEIAISKVGYKEFLSLYKIYQEDMVKAYEQIPTIIPEIETLKNFGILYAKYINTCIPDFQKKIPGSALDKETFLTFAASVIESDLKRKGKSWSICTTDDMDLYLSGLLPFFEYLMVSHGIEIDEDIRKDMYLKVALNSYVRIMGYQNALLGLPRDIKLKQETGPLMRLILHKKMSITDAFTEIESRLKCAQNDFRISTEALVEVYGEEKVGPAIRLMGYIIDGGLYSYKVIKRYGIQKNLKIIH